MKSVFRHEIPDSTETDASWKFLLEQALQADRQEASHVVNSAEGARQCRAKKSSAAISL